MKHILIAAATASYEHLNERDQRPQLEEVLASIVELFTVRLGRYTRELPQIAKDPPADTLRKTLDAWFASAHRDPADWVVLYYTGHADVVGSDSLYLLTRDFEPFQYVGSAFKLDELADMLLAPRAPGEPRRVQNLLLIIDTCFAGGATPKLTAQLANIFQRSLRGAFYVLSAGLPREEAQAGALARALIGAIDELSTRSVQQPYFYLEQIVPEMRKRMRLHKPLLAIVTSPDEDPRFFPNPSFVETGGLPVSASDAQRALSDEEFRQHWGPRARGVEFDSQPGSYFSGRAAVLAVLTAFMNNPDDARTRVVTGRPGSGKSAILSQLVVLSFPESRDRDAQPPATSLDLAIHAKGKSVDEVKRRFADRLGVAPTTEAILVALRQSRGVNRIVVDALDEAAQPAEIAEQLLAPLNALASVKLLVGTRDSQLRALQGAVILDIDAEEYASKADIAQYVYRRLLREGEEGAPTPYAGKEEIARRIAARVAERAHPNFLVARLIVEDLLTRPRAANPRSRADVKFPGSVVGAFDAYLARFGKRTTLVRDLLLPLAFAEGEGLPWDNIWAPVASAISGRRYTDDDVRWVLANAGAFVLEGREEGQSIYRLYHQALADVLRRARSTRSVHGAFTKALIASVPARAGNPRPDWLFAHRHVRTHLATYAARSRKLGALVRDPLYLLAAEPTRLLLALATQGTAIPRAVDEVYKGAVRQIREEIPSLAAAYLESSARQRGASAFADEIAALKLPSSWRVPWVWWTPRPPNYSIAIGESEIVTLEAAEWGTDRPVALVGRLDGTVEAWDVAAAERLFRWTPDGASSVSELALTEARHGPLVVAAWHSGHVGAFNAATGAGSVRRCEGPKGARVMALAVGERDGQPVCVTAHDDCRVVIRALPSLDPIVEKPSATPSKIFCLRVVRDRGEPALLAAGDSLPCDRENDSDDCAMLRFLSFNDLSIVWEDTPRPNGALQSIEIGEIANTAVAAISSGVSPLQVWDIDRRRLLADIPQAAAHAWPCEYDGKPLLLQATGSRVIAYRVAARGPRARRTLALKRALPPIDIAGPRFSGMLRLHGRKTLLSASTNYVRVWDVEDILGSAARGQSTARDLPETGGGVNVATISTRHDWIYVGQRSIVRALDASTGATSWTRTIESGPQRAASIAAMSASVERDWLVVGIEGAFVLLDASTGAEVKRISVSRFLARVRTISWRGRQLLFATLRQNAGDSWAVRVWDLDSGDEAPTHHAYELTHGEQDKVLHGLAVAADDRTVRVAFASRYGKVMVADFTGALGRAQTYPRAYREWPVPHARDEYVKSLAMSSDAGERLLVAGTEYGHLAIWDLDSGETLAARRGAHLGAVDALCFGRLGDRRIFVSGGEDGVLRFWSADLQPMFYIEIGEAILSMAWAGPTRLAVGAMRGLLMIELAALA